MADYSAAINAYNTAYQQSLAAANKQKEEAFAAANNTYNSQASNYKSNWDTQKGNVLGQYDTGANQTNQTAAQALRESYVSNQMQQRNMGQRMAATGRNGGAAESSMLSLANAYGRTREGHETTRANALSDLAQTRDNNLASAEQSYWDRLNAALAARDSSLLGATNTWSSLVQQLEQQRAQQEAAILAQQAQAAAAAGSGGGGYTYPNANPAGPVYGNVREPQSHIPVYNENATAAKILAARAGYDQYYRNVGNTGARLVSGSATSAGKQTK